MVGPQAASCWLGELQCLGWALRAASLQPDAPPGGLTCFSEMLIGSRSTIQVTLSLSGGVVREPG